ncbi:hypothetical protein ACR9M0_00355 [Helicobacter pylori]
MRKIVGAGSFILIAKTLKGINLITNTLLKHPNAKDDWLPGVGESWFLFCVPNGFYRV